MSQEPVQNRQHAAVKKKAHQIQPDIFREQNKF